MVEFLVLLLFHLLGEFYFQNIKIRKDDEICLNKKLILKQTIKYIIPFLLLLFLMNWFYGLIYILILMLLHLILLLINMYFEKRIKRTIIFILDQFFHILILFFISKYIDINNLVEYKLVIKISVCILFIIAPSSIFINTIFQDLYPEIEHGNIFDVGSIIGILERALIFLFAIFQEFTAMAIVITIKTWARSNDLKEQSFRNKYLIGTLASFIMAMAAYLIFRYI